VQLRLSRCDRCAGRETLFWSNCYFEDGAPVSPSTSIQNSPTDFTNARSRAHMCVFLRRPCFVHASQRLGQPGILECGNKQIHTGDICLTLGFGPLNAHSSLVGTCGSQRTLPCDWYEPPSNDICRCAGRRGDQPLQPTKTLRESPSHPRVPVQAASGRAAAIAGAVPLLSEEGVQLLALRAEAHLSADQARSQPQRA